MRTSFDLVGIVGDGRSAPPSRDRLIYLAFVKHPWTTAEGIPAAIIFSVRVAKEATLS
jgi:hypothetical protein